MPAKITKLYLKVVGGNVGKMQNPYWKVVGGNVGGHIYDRQRCSGKLESVIPSNIFRDGLFVIWFFHMSAKNVQNVQKTYKKCITVKPFIVVGGHMHDRQRCS